MSEDKPPGHSDAANAGSVQVPGCSSSQTAPQGVSQGVKVLPVLPRELLCFCYPGARTWECRRGCVALREGWG